MKSKTLKLVSLVMAFGLVFSQASISHAMFGGERSKKSGSYVSNEKGPKKNIIIPKRFGRDLFIRCMNNALNDEIKDDEIKDDKIKDDKIKDALENMYGVGVHVIPYDDVVCKAFVDIAMVEIDGELVCNAWALEKLCKEYVRLIKRNEKTFDESKLRSAAAVAIRRYVDKSVFNVDQAYYEYKELHSSYGVGHY